MVEALRGLVCFDDGVLDAVEPHIFLGESAEKNDHLAIALSGDSQRFLYSLKRGTKKIIACYRFGKRQQTICFTPLGETNFRTTAAPKTSLCVLDVSAFSV